MVNPEKRQVARRLIERFLACEITNDEFDAAFPRDASDPALAAIYERLWLYWDDRKTHNLTGKYAPSEEVRDLFRRCQAFLDAGLEYEWPPLGPASANLILLRMFRFRKAVEKREQQEMERISSYGDFDVWPFLRARDLQQG